MNPQTAPFGIVIVDWGAACNKASGLCAYPEAFAKVKLFSLLSSGHLCSDCVPVVFTLLTGAEHIIHVIIRL